jgi:outer membrane biogenesis lipoprotein LolB
MRVRIVVASLLLLLLTGCTRTVSGLAAAESPGAPPMTPSVENTIWSGTDSEGDAYVFRFRPAGHLAFSSPSGTYDDATDTWTQSGATITLSMSSGYATYKGSIVGNTMAGDASNIVNRNWQWSVTKQ